MGGRFQGMYNLQISSKLGSYEVHIHSISNLLDSRDYDLILADKNLQSHLNKYDHNFKYIEINENIKNLDGVTKLLEEFISNGLNRKSKILIIGGGILQDLATLAASIYMRGIYWDYAPTTLMAMGDSCIGGKSSINFREKKNILGNFFPPNNIYIDTKFTQTLNSIQIISGLSEIIKILYVQDPKSIKATGSYTNFLADKKFGSNLEELIYFSLKAKKDIIERDEFDSGERLLLNFGHTYGHALESSSNFSFPHGIAIALGMLAACRSEHSEVSEESKKLVTALKELLEPIKNELDSWARTIKWDKFKDAIRLDKKGNSNEIKLILPTKNGKVRMLEIDKSNNNLLKIESDMRFALEL